jgi:hypothetical protein
MREITADKSILGAEIGLPQDAISPSIDAIPGLSVPQIEIEGFGIGL